MLKKSYKLLLLPLLLWTVTGCGSKEYYTLGDTSNVISTESYSKTITVKQVDIPKYLKDTDIVKQVTPYKVELIKDAIWLTPMPKHLTDVLISYFQKSLNNPNVYLYPWESASRDSKRVSLKVKKFIAYNNTVILEASYQIKNMRTKEQRTKLFSTRVPTSSETEKIIESMEKAYFQLAEAIKSELVK